ncbi:MAG: glycosyltransferase family 4 protein [Acidobacteriota bacterium]|nr:glycosyltransferase family 4 protein [Acidobacteriota bacterium]
MRILLLNEYYPPDTSATAKMAEQVAEALARKHRVTVLAGRPSYDPAEFYSWRLLRREIRNGVTVERVGSTAYSRHRMRRRVANYLSYLALAVPRALAIRADAVLAMTDPPVAGIAGAAVACIAGRPFVYNIRDLYPEMALAGEIVQPSAWIARWEALHRRALKSAARVIVLGDDMRERILAKGVPPDRVVVVRDGTLLPFRALDASEPESQRVLRELRGNFPFVVLHAGNLGFYGAWDTLIEAAKILRNENIGFVFIGDGAQKRKIEESAAGLPNVRFLPYRPASQIPLVMMAGDVHVITIRRGLEGVVVPSKLYSTLAAGRPVLAVAAANSDAARIVTGSDCGVAADPDDPMAVAASILRMRDDPARVAEMSARARAVAPNYARVAQLERFTEILEQVVPSPVGGEPSGMTGKSS